MQCTVNARDAWELDGRPHNMSALVAEIVSCLKNSCVVVSVYSGRGDDERRQLLLVSQSARRQPCPVCWVSPLSSPLGVSLALTVASVEVRLVPVLVASLSHWAMTRTGQLPCWTRLTTSRRSGRPDSRDKTTTTKSRS